MKRKAANPNSISMERSAESSSAGKNGGQGGLYEEAKGKTVDFIRYPSLDASSRTRNRSIADRNRNETALLMRSCAGPDIIRALSNEERFICLLFSTTRPQLLT